MSNNYNISIDRQTKNAKELPPLARLIYGDICTLAKSSGECFATNKYFAKEYNVSAKTISRHISALKKAGLIGASTRKTEHGYLQRYIAPFLPVDTPKASKAYGQQCPALPDKNARHNINKKKDINNSFGKKEFDYLD